MFEVNAECKPEAVSPEQAELTTWRFLSREMPALPCLFLSALITCALILHMNFWNSTGNQIVDSILRIGTFAGLCTAVITLFRICINGKSYFAPIYWLLAELPKEFYPQDKIEAVAFNAWAFNVVKLRACYCAEHWRGSVNIQTTWKEILEEAQKQEMLVYEEKPHCERDLVLLRLRRRRVEYERFKAERSLNNARLNAEKESRCRLQSFHRAWNVFLMLDMLPVGIGDSKEFLNKAKAELPAGEAAS